MKKRFHDKIAPLYAIVREYAVVFLIKAIVLQNIKCIATL